METEVYRKKSLERISAPEDLNDYLHVTRPPVWIFLVAVIVLIVGSLLWASTTSVKSRVRGKAYVEDGVARITVDDEKYGAMLENGMPAMIGSEETTIDSIGTDKKGGVIGSCKTDLADGVYDFSATFNMTRIISFLFS